jgi:3-deoxy-D-manno-octulosonic-acid transferase
MTHRLYNLLITCLIVFSMPYFLVRGLFRRRLLEEWTQRLGFFPGPFAKRPVWFHAASVGEVFCSVPLVKRLKKEFPDCPIVLTTVTRTGNETAKKYVPEADSVFFLPIDHPLTVGKAITRIHPRLLLIAETELWPNLLRSCGKRGVPVVLFNGRISEKSLRRYLLLKAFFSGCLRSISLFLMQTAEDRDRIVKIGAAPEKTRVAGNLKFDQASPLCPGNGPAEMARSFGLKGGEIVLMAGSTHAGEEEILIGLFKDLRRIDPRLVLVLAPRHLERIEEVERILRTESVSWRRRTSFLSDAGRSDQEPKASPEVILLDTLGELVRLYSLAELVFIGGSLVPVGGHNPLEAIFYRKCVLFGPHMFHFSEMSRNLVGAGGAVQVRGSEDLSFHLKRLLSDGGARREVGERGYQFLERHRGATEKMFAEIRPYLTSLRNGDCGIRNL